MIEVRVDGTSFHLHWRKWISDVTGTNTVFDVEARRLWWEWTAQKVAPHLTAKNHCGVEKFFSK